MKERYESIKTEDVKFTIKWVGALIAEVSDGIDSNNDRNINSRKVFLYPNNLFDKFSTIKQTIISFDFFKQSFDRVTVMCHYLTMKVQRLISQFYSFLENL